MFNNKPVNIIITVLVFISTTGITIDRHYSNNELYSVSLVGDAKSCCEGVCDCCDNVTERFQIKDNFLVSDIKKLIVYLSFTEIVLSNNNLFNINSVHSLKKLFLSDRSPPNIYFTSPFLQVFLI